MDLLHLEASQVCHSDSELSNMDRFERKSSLKRHSHFFLSPPTSTRSRPRSVPLLSDNDDNDAASPMVMTVLDDSSSERIDRDSVDTAETEGCPEDSTIYSMEKEGGIR